MFLMFVAEYLNFGKSLMLYIYYTIYTTKKKSWCLIKLEKHKEIFFLN